MKQLERQRQLPPQGQDYLSGETGTDFVVVREGTGRQGRCTRRRAEEGKHNADCTLFPRVEQSGPCERVLVFGPLPCSELLSVRMWWLACLLCSPGPQLDRDILGCPVYGTTARSGTSIRNCAGQGRHTRRLLPNRLNELGLRDWNRQVFPPRRRQSQHQTSPSMILPPPSPAHCCSPREFQHSRYPFLASSSSHNAKYLSAQPSARTRSPSALYNAAFLAIISHRFSASSTTEKHLNAASSVL